MYEDGEESIHDWDGQDTWILITEVRPSKLRYAVVDPDEVLALDIHPNNNSRFRKKQPTRAATKWAGFWMIWVQDLLAGWTFFI